MALTGLGLLLFVIAHMVGNLQVFLGPEAINRYAHFLKSNPEILWPSRIGLLTLVLVHIATGVALTLENWRTRPNGYSVQKVVNASVASRTMVVTGLIVVCFVVYHLAHYTLLTVHPEYRQLMRDGHHDVYGMIVAGFSNPAVAGFYVLSVGLLCFHLSHGVGALFQSLGLKNEAYAGRIDVTAKLLATLLFLGYASVPVAVQLGMVK